MAKYHEIVDYLLAKVARNEINLAQTMPTIRELAERFQCSKATVVRAYTELQQNHVVYSVPQQGYFLVNKAKKVLSPAVINFAVAAPNEEILPYQEFQHCLNQAIGQYQSLLFNYSAAQGLPGLIHVLVKYLQNYQVFTNPDNLFITAGSQQAIAILSAMRFPNNKTTVLVEQPTYTGMLKTLELNRIPVVGIERNFDGIDLNDLERKFATGHIKCFYTSTRFHNPLGTNLSKNDIKQIVRLANKYDVYVIEDDYLGDLALTSTPYPLYYEDVSSRVIYIKSFSKLLLPGLRIAAVVLPKNLVSTFETHKKWADLGTSVLSQGALEIYISCGMSKAHKRKIRTIYERKMAMMQEKVQAAMTPHVRWHIPDSGFFACCEFLNHTDVSKMIKNLQKKNVLLHDIRENYLEPYYNNKILKLCVSKVNFSDMNDGLAILFDELNRTL